MLESCKLRRVRENNKDVEGHLKNCMQFLVSLTDVSALFVEGIYCLSARHLLFINILKLVLILHSLI